MGLPQNGDSLPPSRPVTSGGARAYLAIDPLATGWSGSWPLSGESKLIVTEQMEHVNGRRGDFPEYDRACKASQETLQISRAKPTRPLDEDFPLYAAALKKRQDLG